MKKALFALALVFILVPSISFAATDAEIKASVVQQILSMFVVQVNALEKVQTLVSQSSNPSQFDTFSGLVANQLSQTTAQLATLLNPTGVPVQGEVITPVGSNIITPNLVLTNNSEQASIIGGGVILGGSCGQAIITSNVSARFINPETSIMYTGKQFVYRPIATGTTQTIQVTIDGFSTSTTQVIVGPSLYEYEMAKDPTGNRFNKLTSDLWVSKAIGYTVNPLTGMCI